MIEFAKDINIYFTGFMASGKSRVGAAVAAKLDWPFIDTDKLIEERYGASISEIFEKEGEDYFRKMEREIIAEISETPNHVVSLGGGALANPGVLDTIHHGGILIRLWAPMDVLVERIGRKESRPLLAGLDEDARRVKIQEMLDEREPFYSKADFSVQSNNDTPVKNVANEVVHRLQVWSRKRVTVSPESAPDYPIFIGRGYLGQLSSIIMSLDLNTDFLVCSDTNVAEKQSENMRKIRNQCSARSFQFPAGEENKNMTHLNKLYSFMLKRGYSRKTTLLQFSGGVVGDMAGFAAATYQRGIPFVQIPTTLLSMVDSSVGGKVAVNHPLGKNMIGAFYQPRAVVIDLEVLETLPHEEYLAGLAEVVKYGVIRDPEFFEYIENNVEGILNKEQKVLEHLVQRSCELKAEVVGIDEKEQGLRAILNYGHTFGHAIEKVTAYKKFSHGIAVSLGMRVAGRLSTLMALWTPEEEDRQNKLLDRLGLPKHFDISAKDAWTAMGVDKKVEKSNRVYILPTKIGDVDKVKNAPEEMVHDAWKAISKK